MQVEGNLDEVHEQQMQGGVAQDSVQSFLERTTEDTLHWGNV